MTESSRNYRGISLAILIAGGILRISGIVVSPFWYDEAYTIFLARLPDLMIRFKAADFNPPLWQIVVFPFIRLLGETEIAIRLPALLASLSAMILTWLIAESLLKRWWMGGYIYPAVAVLIALLPYHFWLSQDGRVYALMSLLYMAAILMTVKRRWMGFGACLGLLLYSHTVGIFYASAAVIGALILQWQDRKRIVMWSLIAIASFLPWVPSLLISGIQHLSGPLTDNNIIVALYEIFWAGDLPLIYVIPADLLIVISILVALIVSIFRWRKPGHSALTVWAIGPLIFMLIAAPIKNVVFYRSLSAMLLPMAIWLPVCLMPTHRVKPWNPLCYLPALWGLAVLIGLLYWSPSLKGGELRSMSELINTEWKTGDVIYHATGTSYLPFSLYLHEPSFLLDEQLNEGLLQTNLQEEFGIKRVPLEKIPRQRSWIIWARDPLISPQANQRMAYYTHDAVLIGRVHYWQAAYIEVYLQSHK